jgi:uncharacterized protein (UPF0548 family)
VRGRRGGYLAEVGQIGQKALPEGYHHQRRSADVGTGAPSWVWAKKALATLQADRRVSPGYLPARRASRHGAVVLATPDISPARLVLPYRVVHCTDEARSFGFAYGTLLGRPERGEESFDVRLDDQGVVSFHVVAFSRPGDLATELALGRSPRHPVDTDAPLHKGHQEVRGGAWSMHDKGAREVPFCVPAAFGRFGLSGANSGVRMRSGVATVRKVPEHHLGMRSLVPPAAIAVRAWRWLTR